MAAPNRYITLAASQTVTAAGNTTELAIVGPYTAADILINVTAFTGTSITFFIQKVAQAAGSAAFPNPPLGTKYYDDLASSTAIAATGQYLINIVGGGNVAAHAIKDGTLAAGTANSGALGSTWRIKWTGTITSVTFDITADLIP